MNPIERLESRVGPLVVLLGCLLHGDPCLGQLGNGERVGGVLVLWVGEGDVALAAGDAGGWAGDGGVVVVALGGDHVGEGGGHCCGCDDDDDVVVVVCVSESSI